MEEKRKNNEFISDFTRWLASHNAVSFALAVGVAFLFTNYSMVLHNTNPDKGAFSYPYWVIIVISHLDSFFFALTTAIVMFQAISKYQKIFFVSLEGIMIFLNLNRNFISRYFDYDEKGQVIYKTLSESMPEFSYSQLLLGSYIAFFSAVAFYNLGLLAYNHLKDELLASDLLAQAKEWVKQAKEAFEKEKKEFEEQMKLEKAKIEKALKDIQERERRLQEDEDLQEEFFAAKEASDIIKKNQQGQSEGYAKTKEEAQEWFKDKQKLYDMIEEGYSMARILKDAGISRTTYYRGVHNHRIVAE